MPELEQITIEGLIDKVRQYNPEADTILLQMAYDYAKEAHGTQTRMSGEPYITHPLATAYNLANMRMDEVTLAAGLLHDVPEDTARDIKDIKKEFGGEIAFLVEGITKLGMIKYRGMDRYVENLRRMFVAMARDIRVVLIKFADRMHNLQTLDAHQPYKRYRIALETLEIYAPIANRLGIGEIKGQLEDLAFPYVYPDESQWLQQKVKDLYKERAQYIEKFRKDIKKTMAENQIPFIAIDGRAKHHYSLYKKLITHDRDITKIYDLVALRIVVKTVADCYAALGVVHHYCKPLKGRIKDYIAQPKPNGYQSLHTTVFTPQGKILEIQIRTQEMHEEAEFGIAAHWNYKEQGSKKVKKDQLKWLNQLTKMQDEATTEKQYLESLKIDIFQTHIFVFTPKGDVIDLPEQATPIDFAYYIHTDLGNKCAGAKVNDQLAGLDAKLKSGDVVEIIIDKKRPGPAEEWLSFVQTNTARHNIKHYLNKQKKRGLQKLFSFSQKI